MEKHKPISCLAILRHELPEDRFQIIYPPCKRSVKNGATICSTYTVNYFLKGSNAGFMFNQVSKVKIFQEPEKETAAAQSMLLFFLQTNILNTKI